MADGLLDVNCFGKFGDFVGFWGFLNKWEWSNFNRNLKVSNKRSNIREDVLERVQSMY